MRTISKSYITELKKKKSFPSKRYRVLLCFQRGSQNKNHPIGWFLFWLFLFGLNRQDIMICDVSRACLHAAGGCPQGKLAIWPELCDGQIGCRWFGAIYALATFFVFACEMPVFSGQEKLAIWPELCDGQIGCRNERKRVVVEPSRGSHIGATILRPNTKVLGFQGLFVCLGVKKTAPSPLHLFLDLMDLNLRLQPWVEEIKLLIYCINERHVI